jgi:hypothetical protein
MATDVYREKLSKNILFVALVVLWPFVVSCKAQTLVQTIFEPAPGSRIAMACGPGNITTGDVNNDGKTDLVAACGKERSLTIFIGRGNGQFDVAADNPLLLPYAPNELEIADMNNDDQADLVIASHDSYDIMILPGNGKGNFTVSDDFMFTMKEGNHPHTHGLGIRDMNSDGFPDIVTANSTDNDIAVLLNDSRNSFVPCPGFTVSCKHVTLSANA